jgi:hypothetical protein
MTASNNSRQYAFVAESTFGVTPASPNTQLIELVDFTGDLNATQLSSASLNSHRQTSDARRGNLSAEGELQVEMVAGNYDPFLAAVMGSAWIGNVLKVGNTKSSYAIEEGFLDLGQYRVFNGMTFNTFAVEINTDNLITATFGLLGAGATAFSGSSIDASPTAVTTKPKFFHEEGTISEGGTPIAYLSAVSFELNNNITGNYALGSTSYHSLSLGRVSVTGTITGLCDSFALYNKFVNNTDSTLSVVLSAGSPAETLTFAFPKVKYTSGTIQRSDTGPVMFELGFEAVYDSTAATSMSITRSA